MGVEITAVAITSDVTAQMARRVEGGWELSWLPGRVFDRDRAVTGMVLAETVARELLTSDNPQWPLIDQWAGELGLTGPDAVGRISIAAGRRRIDPPPPEFVCPRCGKRSWNPHDRVHGWCGACRDYTAPPRAAGPAGRTE